MAVGVEGRERTSERETTSRSQQRRGAPSIARWCRSIPWSLWCGSSFASGAAGESDAQLPPARSEWQLLSPKETDGGNDSFERCDPHASELPEQCAAITHPNRWSARPSLLLGSVAIAREVIKAAETIRRRRSAAAHGQQKQHHAFPRKRAGWRRGALRGGMTCLAAQVSHVPRGGVRPSGYCASQQLLRHETT
jgi:hypothetical protein